MARLKRLFVMARDTPFVHEIFRGINEYCSGHGAWEYNISGSSAERIRHSQTDVNEWAADGIIAQVTSPAMERVLLKLKRPTVNFSGLLEMKIPTVRMDDLLIGRLVARYFLENGFQNFGFCALTAEGYAKKRCKAFSDEISAAGYSCDVFTDRWRGLWEWDWAKTRERMVPWILSLKKPVAIMCLYDRRAHELVMMCRHHGLRVPDDVAIIGAGNDESICNLSDPPISSIDLNIQKVGYEAARLLHRLLEGAKPPEAPILIPPRRVVVRRSSDGIAIEDPQIAEVMRYIRQHASEPVSIKEMLDEVPISRRAMERRFVKLVGRTPKEEIMRMRMQLASGLLESTDLQMPAIAKRSGFSREETFSRAFRREMGLSPTEYRQRSKIDRSGSGV